jgi:hypothetical protein
MRTREEIQIDAALNAYGKLLEVMLDVRDLCADSNALCREAIANSFEAVARVRTGQFGDTLHVFKAHPDPSNPNFVNICFVCGLPKGEDCHTPGQRQSDLTERGIKNEGQKNT